MISNEKGSTLILVLLAITVFTIIGITVLASTVGEKKRVEKTESNVQSLHLAESGLTFFEADFRKYIEDAKLNSDTIDILQFINKYKEYVPVGTNKNPDETQIKVEFLGLAGEYNLAVKSKGIANNSEKVLTGYYMLKYDFYNDHEGPVFEIADFTKGGVPQNFTDKNVLGLGVGALLNLDLLTIAGPKDYFHRVPDAKGLLSLNLGGLISLGGGRGDFSAYTEKPIIATKEGGLLGLNVLNKLVTINLLQQKVEENTNVLIDGSYLVPRLLILGETVKFSDIDFKKFAVVGNVVIQQDKLSRWGLLYNDTEDKADRRRFSFDEGLFVFRSIEIGGKQSGSKYSNLMLRGDMVANENLYINHVDLMIGDSKNEKHFPKESDKYFSNMYVHGDAKINDACINLRNDNYKFGVFVKGKLTIENNSKCNEFPGFYYAEGGIEIKTNNKEMVINGALIGEITNIDYEDKLIINWDEKYLPKVKVKNVDLFPRGRVVDK